MTKDSQKPATKSTIIQTLAEKSELSRSQITTVLEALEGLIKMELGKKGPGIFKLPGLLQIKKVEKPATKARMGVKPGTTEPMMFKAKPKTTIVRVKPLKGLKEMVK